MRGTTSRFREKMAQGLALLRGMALRRCHGLSIGEKTRVSWRARIDTSNPQCLHIGAYSDVSDGAAVLTYDPVTGRHADTVIGNCTFIGDHVIVYPGIHIGDHCIIGAGSVVMNDIPSHSLAAGNPARLIHGSIRTSKYGVLDQTSLPGSRRYGELEVVGAQDDDRRA